MLSCMLQCAVCPPHPVLSACRFQRCVGCCAALPCAALCSAALCCFCCLPVWCVIMCCVVSFDAVLCCIVLRGAVLQATVFASWCAIHAALCCLAHSMLLCVVVCCVLFTLVLPSALVRCVVAVLSGVVHVVSSSISLPPPPVCAAFSIVRCPRCCCVVVCCVRCYAALCGVALCCFVVSCVAMFFGAVRCIVEVCREEDTYICLYTRMLTYIYSYTLLPFNLASKQPQAKSTSLFRFGHCSALSLRALLYSTLAILEPRWWPCHIQVFSQKLTGGGPGLERQIGRCLPKNAHFVLQNSLF